MEEQANAFGKLAGKGCGARPETPAPTTCGEGKCSGANYVAPRTPVEELVAGIWSEILNVPRVGIQDNFFDLGGHSLIAMRIVVRVCTTLRTDVSLHSVFEAPTVEEFSRIVIASELKPGQVGRIAEIISAVRNTSASSERLLQRD